jgi:hypothetical protein
MHHVGCHSWQPHWHALQGDQKISFLLGIVHGNNSGEIDASAIGFHWFPRRGTFGTRIGWHHEGGEQQVH